jgi:hypothetical protein
MDKCFALQAVEEHVEVFLHGVYFARAKEMLLVLDNLMGNRSPSVVWLVRESCSALSIQRHVKARYDDRYSGLLSTGGRTR